MLHGKLTTKEEFIEAANDFVHRGSECTEILNNSPIMSGVKPNRFIEIWSKELSDLTESLNKAQEDFSNSEMTEISFNCTPLYLFESALTKIFEHCLCNQPRLGLELGATSGFLIHVRRLKAIFDLGAIERMNLQQNHGYVEAYHKMQALAMKKGEYHLKERIKDIQSQTKRLCEHLKNDKDMREKLIEKEKLLVDKFKDEVIPYLAPVSMRAVSEFIRLRKFQIPPKASPKPVVKVPEPPAENPRIYHARRGTRYTPKAVRKVETPARRPFHSTPLRIQPAVVIPVIPIKTLEEPSKIVVNPPEEPQKTKSPEPTTVPVIPLDSEKSDENPEKSVIDENEENEKESESKEESEDKDDVSEDELPSYSPLLSRPFPSALEALNTYTSHEDEESMEQDNKGVNTESAESKPPSEEEPNSSDAKEDECEEKESLELSPEVKEDSDMVQEESGSSQSPDVAHSENSPDENIPGNVPEDREESLDTDPYPSSPESSKENAAPSDYYARARESSEEYPDDHPLREVVSSDSESDQRPIPLNLDPVPLIQEESMAPPRRHRYDDSDYSPATTSPDSDGSRSPVSEHPMDVPMELNENDSCSELNPAPEVDEVSTKSSSVSQPSEPSVSKVDEVLNAGPEAFQKDSSHSPAQESEQSNTSFYCLDETQDSAFTESALEAHTECEVVPETKSSELLQPAQEHMSSELIQPTPETMNPEMVEPSQEIMSSELVKTSPEIMNSEMLQPSAEAISSKRLQPALGALSSEMLQPAPEAMNSELFQSAPETTSHEMLESAPETTSSELLESAPEADITHDPSSEDDKPFGTTEKSPSENTPSSEIQAPETLHDLEDARSKSPAPIEVAPEVVRTAPEAENLNQLFSSFFPDLKLNSHIAPIEEERKDPSSQSPSSIPIAPTSLELPGTSTDNRCSTPKRSLNEDEETTEVTSKRKCTEGFNNFQSSS